MTDSLFLAAARAMDDTAFSWRIKSAVLYHAAALLPTAENHEYNYAVTALLNPGQLDPTMMAMICVDPTIAAAMTVTEGVVDTTAVDDSLILSTVISNWAMVAVKYPVNPLLT